MKPKRGLETALYTILLEGQQCLETEGYVAGAAPAQVADEEGIQLFQIPSGASEGRLTIDAGH
ncbi:MAG: hypothetical protein LUQ15_05125 [Methanothrix sp.]|nr:hypothetical protein [Methanothrix sp.]